MGRLTGSSPQTIERPDTELPGSGEHWIVTVFDNDHNTVDQVIDILLAATSCSIEEAEIETWEIHHLGRSVVHHGGPKECEDVADIIRQIGIRVEVSQE